ncbi:hypothetical protein [Streptacidiphilus jiangxiensis]|uniref:Transcriptional regulator n=1 Tax=Streptacidiphilus jiangxiensis TaxID=235985 RepID=A0A1H7YD56_STRJI|nr:hypothetical protein [Streptacidiphilus jiangxiensis]SEM43893.1 hypothetical protein SAMN05414137_12819 [Streptacidiphilus jiangxiensis]
MAPRHPNVRLRALAHEAGWSGAALARAVNRAGAEIGLTLRYDRTSVAHWMAGTRPPADVAAVVAEALARRLGRPLRPADAGLAPEPPERVAVAAARPALVELAELDAVQPRARPYRLGAAEPPLTPPLPPVASVVSVAPVGSAPSGRAHHRGPAGERVTVAHVRAAQNMLHTFTVVDSAYGGGHSRAALTGFLRSSVAQWLAAPAAPRTRRELLLVASALTCLAGSMCHDEQRHGVAQGYYLAAARLSAEADDAPGQAAALRALSMQAHELGHRDHALTLAEAATSHRSRLPTLLAAAVVGQLAVAAAGRGERRRALTVLERSAELLGRADAGGDYHRAAHEHHQAEVLDALGDRPGAVAALRRSVRLRPYEERRARAVSNARLGELLLDGGTLEPACAAWHAFLDDWPLLRSARADRAARTLRSRLRPFHATAPGRGVLTRLQAL